MGPGTQRMTETRVSGMQLTTYVLADNNWQLWRREVIIGMKRLNAYKIMTGDEPQPVLAPDFNADSKALLEAHLKLSNTTVQFAGAKMKSKASPDDAVAKSNFKNAQKEFEDATERYCEIVESNQKAESDPKKASQTAEWQKCHDQAYHMLIMSLSEN